MKRLPQEGSRRRLGGCGGLLQANRARKGHNFMSLLARVLTSPAIYCTWEVLRSASNLANWKQRGIGVKNSGVQGTCVRANRLLSPKEYKPGDNF